MFPLAIFSLKLKTLQNAGNSLSKYFTHSCQLFLLNLYYQIIYVLIFNTLNFWHYSGTAIGKQLNNETERLRKGNTG